MRAQCLAADGGSAVMRAVHLCHLRRAAVPDWLRDEFSRRFLLVHDAHVGSWDEAFGRPYPKNTRLHDLRRRRQLLGVVHAAVWELAVHQGRNVTRDLFEEVGERREVNASGATVERLYYEALRQGRPSAAAVRKVLDGQANPQAMPQT